MKAIMLMFDSLNKRLLSAYGSDRAITPNFQRLKERTVRFDNFYVGSMPCMPARRELHTGRYNFLHRGWSPLEPFDDSVPEILKKNGIHTHLVTDHKHYWRDGGATYHSRYSTYEFIRGQEGDAWKGVVDKPEYRYESGEPEEIKQRRITSRVQHQINVQFMQNEEDHHLARTINKGLEFIDTNHASDNWFLQLECFDPHEPFFVPEKYLRMYGIDDPSQFDGWPPYYFLTESPERKSVIQKYYMALLTMVDAYVGKVLDYMDHYDLWQDTMLIVNTDHGFLLGEHEWWGKNIMPLYNEVANIPCFIWHPQHGCAGESRQALAQTIDIPATLLDSFGLPKPQDMQGVSLLPVLRDDTPVRNYALFGYHGCHINITDGRYVYMRAPVTQGVSGLYEYTLMPTRINRRFTPSELQGMTLHPPFGFTKGCKVLKIPAESVMTRGADRFGHRLYDLHDDPLQQTQSRDTAAAERLCSSMKAMMAQSDAPSELYPRYGLEDAGGPLLGLDPHLLPELAAFAPVVRYGLFALLQHLEGSGQTELMAQLQSTSQPGWTTENLWAFVQNEVPQEQHQSVYYKMALEMRLD
ncbi:TPA: sulfatase [Klebsiella pneumoniae]|nr:sulfatase [Klebsiella pneumoniae]HBW2991709.1 sulfatase [Klebsiella pneumoniae]HBY6442617.1 sulfatase [Klebsiella pneumoniae]HBY6476535.1 sulfatase [Klebsiella pneumoniae]HBY6505324.1 sulfatase [Klebsiella pneumoniae]